MAAIAGSFLEGLGPAAPRASGRLQLSWATGPPSTPSNACPYTMCSHSLRPIGAGWRD